MSMSKQFFSFPNDLTTTSSIWSCIMQFGNWICYNNSFFMAMRKRSRVVVVKNQLACFVALTIETLIIWNWKVEGFLGFSFPSYYNLSLLLYAYIHDGKIIIAIKLFTKYCATINRRVYVLNWNRFFRCKLKFVFVECRKH